MKLILATLALLLALTFATPAQAHGLVLRCGGHHGHCAPRIVRH